MPSRTAFASQTTTASTRRETKTRSPQDDYILPTGNGVMRLFGADCECPSCGLHFRSTGSFDRHQTGPHNARTCLQEHEIEALGMVSDDYGFWSLPPRAVKAENLEPIPDHDYSFYLQLQ